MKCLLLADDRLDLLSTLEPILKHWGYRVLTATAIDQVGTFLAESDPALLIIGSNLYRPDLQLPRTDLPLIVLEHPQGAGLETGHTTLTVPVDIFELFTFIQNRVERHPRCNLRLRLRLPGMYSARGGYYVLSDILSLSMAGLFFRSPMKLAKGNRVTVVLPLLGHGKEMELSGTVLYIVEPTAQNNYVQGFGLGFDPLPPKQVAQLEHFIAESFLKEVASCQPGVGDFSTDQIRR